MARALRVGLLVDGLLSRYQVRLFDSVRRAARRRGAVVVGFPGSYLGGQVSDHATFDGSFIYDLAGPSSVDGIIVASNLIMSGAGSARVRALREQNSVPVVSIGPLPGVTTVDVDNHAGLKQIVQHLVVSHGCRKLAFIRGPLTNPDSLDRERVFRSTLTDLDVEVDNELIVTGNFLESSGAAAVRTLLGERHVAITDIDAIVVANDQMATGAMQELRARGFRVPEDLAIVGFDDDDHARSAQPPLTTVAQPIERLGQTSVDLLIDKIAGRSTPDHTLLQTLPVLRRSCGCRDGLRSPIESVIAPEELQERLEALRASTLQRFEWLGADERAGVGFDHACEYLMGRSGEPASDLLRKVERSVLDLATQGIDPLHWQDILSPVVNEAFCCTTNGAGIEQSASVRSQRLFGLFSELSGMVLLQEQLRTIEFANSLRVIGSAVVCARHFRALGRVLDAGLPGLDVHYCCVCMFTSGENTRAKVATLYHPAVPRPHNQIHSAQQLWRAVPPTVPPGTNASSVGTQSFKASAILPPNGDTPPEGDLLVFPLMFGEEALGYVVFDVPADTQRTWLLEGLSGHLSSAIYEIARTEQLRLARELAEEANSAKSAFVAMMSHEVRTPLNAIMGNLDLCLRTELNKEQRTHLLRAQTSSRALRSIVDGILDYSRVEAQRLDLESAPFQLEEVLEQVVSTCAPDACRKDLELVLDVDCRIPQRIIGDSLRLTQVLLNLVNNALKFSTRGHVALRINRLNPNTVEPLELHFVVEDTGIGMSPEQVARIFQPFTQADSSITRRYGGTGLGLTICQRLVELMGGEIQVRSEVGKGSVFEFVIPLRAEVEVPVATSMQPVAVLLVINATAQLQALTRLFENLGHDVYTAPDGHAAIDFVAKWYAQETRRRCFLFTDHRLSDMSGQALSAHLRQYREDAGLSVVMLVPHDNDALLAGNWQHATGESILAKPPLRSSVERVLLGFRSSYPASLEFASELNITHGALAGRRVLVVQDSDMSRELAYDLLTLNGAEVRTAVDGAEAIDLANSERFDLVLMDLHLPNVDGCAATRSIRERHGATALPIVALSASAAPEDRARCLEAGMNDFLRAPIGAAELIDTVQRWLLCGANPTIRVSSAPPNSTALRINADAAPVLDVAKALGRLGGNPTLYRQLLKRFTHSYAGNFEELTNLVDESDFVKAANLVHVLVSAAGNIGATRLQNAAQALEIALRQSHVGRVIALRPRFEAEWHASIQAASGALDRQLEGSRPAPGYTARIAVYEQIEQLRKLIHEHDTAAVELVEQLEETFASEPGTHHALQQLAQSVTAYDFESAQLHLDSLSTSLSVKAPLMPQGVT